MLSRVLPILICSTLMVHVPLCAQTQARTATSKIKAPEVAAMRQMYNGAMRPSVAVDTFSHTDQLLPVRMARRGGPVQELARSTQPFPSIHFQSEGREFDLYDYLAINRVAGLLVLKNGKIAFEDYELSTDSNTRWASFSMAKSISSTLIGAALKDGSIASIDDPVTRYVPALKGGAYEGVSIRNVLLMASGVSWAEAYTSPTSDRRKLLDGQLTLKPGVILGYMNGLKRAGLPGSKWNYNTGEACVVGAVIEGATHRPLADYLSEKIWSKAGMESDATWWLESPNGMGFGGGGFGATLRDYGRFGLIAADEGRVNGQSIVPDGWFKDAGASHTIGEKKIDYGYLWWIPAQHGSMDTGAFEAEGIFGQYLYVNPREHVVIVVLSARSKPGRGSRVELDDDAFFASVVRSLH